MKFKIARMLATFFYTGLSRVCPGTVGSVCTLPLWFVVIATIATLSLNPIISVLVFILFLYIIGYYVTKIYITETQKDDPGEVVIDEVVGQMLAFALSFAFLFVTKNYNIQYIKDFPIINCSYFFILPIILFRIYDIKKPWIIGKIDRDVKGATGIMLDDVIGGIFAGLTCSILMLIVLYFI